MNTPTHVHKWRPYSVQGVVCVHDDIGPVWMLLAHCLVDGCNIDQLKRDNILFVVDHTMLEETESKLRFFLPRGKETEVKQLGD